MYENDTEVISFYASDDSGNAINYDSYEVKSQNGDIIDASLSDNDGTGKYVNFAVHAGKDGSAKINVIATKNTASWVYTIDVTAKKASTAIGTVNLTIDRTTVSNTFDSVYQDENIVKVNVKDTNGVDVTEQYLNSIDLQVTVPKDKANEGRTFTTSTAAQCTMYKGKFEISGNTNMNADKSAAVNKFSAAGVKSGTYYITAEVNGKKSSPKTIDVKNVDDNYYLINGAKNDIQYDIVADKKITIGKGDEEKSGTARLAAYTKGSGTSKIFISYVEPGGSIKANLPAAGQFTTNSFGSAESFVTAGGTGIIQIAATSTIDATSGVKAYIEKGGKYGAGLMYMSGTNFTGKTADLTPNNYNTELTAKYSVKNGFKYTANDTTNPIYYANKKPGTDYGVAEAGELYTVGFAYVLPPATGKPESLTTTKTKVTVVNNIKTPTVSVENRNTGSLEAAKIIEAMKTNVDLTCNESNNKSIKEIFGAWNNTHKKFDTWAEPTDDKVKTKTVGAVGVLEDGWEIIVSDGSWEFDRS